MFSLNTILAAENSAVDNDEAEDGMDLEEWLRMEDLDDLEDLGLPHLEEDLEPLPVWDVETILSTGAGYRDNTWMSAAGREGGAFLLGAIESSILRFPDDGFEVSVLLNAETLQFLSSRNLPDDSFASAFSRIRIPVFRDSTFELTLLAMHFDQVTDPSRVVLGEFDPVAIRGNRFGATPALWTDWPNRLATYASFEVSRRELQDPLNDYWEFGPTIGVEQSQGDTRFGFQIGFALADFDDRLARDEEGEPIEDTSLEFRLIRPEVQVRQSWGENNRWRLRGSLGAEFNRDNDIGGFDYNRVRASKRLTFQGDLWEARGRVAYSYFDHAIHWNDDPRSRHTVNTGVKITRKLAEKIHLFARHEWQTVRAIESDNDYSVNTSAIGLDWKF